MRAGPRLRLPVYPHLSLSSLACRRRTFVDNGDGGMKMIDDLRGDFDLSEGELRMVVSLTLSSLSILFRWQDEVKTAGDGRDAVDGQQRCSCLTVP